MYYQNQYNQFTQSSQQLGFPAHQMQYQGFSQQQQSQQNQQLFNGYNHAQSQIYAPKPAKNGANYIQNQFVKSSSPMLNQFGNFASLNNQDQYSENSTSCGSEENNQDDFLDQMPQLQSNLSIKPICNNSSSSAASNNFTSQQQQSANLQKGKMNNNNNNASNSSSTNAVIPEEAKYKTEMCKNWVETGKCNYGDKCKFAHGKNELVQKIAANKLFKTKRCKQYFETCICNYGPRCHFVHDIRTVQEIQSTNLYQKMLINPEIYLDLSTSLLSSSTLSQSSSLSSSSSSSSPSSSSFAPKRRLELFQKFSNTSSSISTTTSQ